MPTTPGDNLLTMLGAESIEPSELSYLLLEHFKKARHVSENEVVFESDATKEAVRLIYHPKKLETLIGIRTGPAWTPTDLEVLRTRIKQELIESPGEVIGNAVIFSSRCTTGWWKCNGILQIISPPADAPTPRFPAMGGNPLILQFPFRSSCNFVIKHARRVYKARQLAALLNALLIGDFHQQNPWTRYRWVWHPDNKEGSFRYIYAQEGYSFEGLGEETSTFGPTEDILPIKEVSPNAYYDRWSASGAGDPLTVPTSLAESLTRFHNLSPDDQNQYLRACYWFQHSSNVWSQSRSSTFLALVTTVEVFSYHGKGSTDEFVEFLEKYAPGDGETEKQRKELYRLRAALSHGGKLFSTDLAPSYLNMDPQQLWEMELHGNMQHIVRIALINRLHDESNMHTT